MADKRPAEADGTGEIQPEGRAPAAALFVGCGGGSLGMGVSTANSTPAGTYTLTVTANSGRLSQSSQITLKVQ